MIRLQDVPRHKRQGEFEALFCLGPKELLLKTYSASWQTLLGKLWISTSAVSFSSGGFNKKQVVHFSDVREVRSAGFRTVVFVLMDNSVFEISSLWHKDECFSYASSLWWNSARPNRSPSAPQPTIEVEDVVLIGSSGSDYSGRISPSPLSGGGGGVGGGGGGARKSSAVMTAETVVGQTLDDLDELADLLLLPVTATVQSPSCDGYGFPLLELQQRYDECMRDYQVFAKKREKEISFADLFKQKNRANKKRCASVGSSFSGSTLSTAKPCNPVIEKRCFCFVLFFVFFSECGFNRGIFVFAGADTVVARRSARAEAVCLFSSFGRATKAQRG